MPLKDEIQATGAQVTLHDVSYAISMKKARKVILEDISCKYPVGLNAILGPTGCGKTSLLDIIAGRKDPKGQCGMVLVDGHHRPDHFRQSIGYVVQDDVVYGTLTVKENISFSANLRLGPNISQKAKETLVDRTLHDLGLNDCADSKVGNAFIRGVSGGERKRTQIGMELVISPNVLFLDEGTTGLDANTANSLLGTLKILSQNGHTIIMSIHQPRYSMFKLFDYMTLLSMGRLVYHGPAKDSIQYFENIGFYCEEYNNPADFFLDIINADSTAVQTVEEKLNECYVDKITTVSWSTGGGKEPSSLSSPEEHPATSDDTNNMKLKSSDNIQEGEITIAEKLEGEFKSSQIYISQKQELDRIFEDATNNPKVKPLNVANQTSFGTQVKHISRRILQNNWRNPGTYITQIIVVVIASFLVGGIYFQMNESISQGIPNRVGAAFLIIMTQVFKSMSAIDVFIRERAVFMHENSAGFYGCFAYFLSKVLCDVIPMRMQPVVLASIIVYFMIGFQLQVVKFFLYVLNLFLANLAATCVCFVAGSSIRVFAIAQLLVGLVFVFMTVFSGFLVKLSSVGWWVRWVTYFSICKYSFNGVLINELENMTFCESSNGTTHCDPQAGNNYLRSQEIDYGTSWDFWKNELALVIICLGLLFVSYLQLRFIKKTT